MLGLSDYLLSKKHYKFPNISVHELGLDRNFLENLTPNKHDFLFDSTLNYSDLGAWTKQFFDCFSPDTLVIENLVEDLIGIRGKSIPNESEKLRYFSFINSLSNFPFSKFNIRKDVKMSAALLADLGSIVDVYILNSLDVIENLRVLEIGGGYGRLAQACWKNLGTFESWYLLDVIPSSLALAAYYLNANHVPVGQSDSDMNVKLTRLRDLESISDNSIDISINIESFQEMTQDYVDFYLDVIDKKSKIGSFFFHSNSFNYKNFFYLSLGQNWKKICEFSHPRHWTSGHRTEVFKKFK